MNGTTPSPDLVAANQRLLELRQEVEAQRPSPLSPPPSQLSTDNSTPTTTAARPSDLFTAAVQVAKLPAHLGWGSEPATQAIRAALQRQYTGALTLEPLRADHLPSHPIPDESHADGQPLVARTSSAVEDQQLLPLYRDTLRHYPSLGIAALQQEQAAIYRIWLLSRHLDGVGQGWLPLQRLRSQLTEKESRLRMCGWRRLRQSLGQGHGRFWQWDKAQGRLWLFGAVHVADNLGVTRLVGRVVALPITAVTASIGEFKAHLYAAWHSGRKRNNPISRQVQQTLTGIPERTQRHYCQVAHVSNLNNIAVAGSYCPEEEQKQAWQHGRAIFVFTDYYGRLGRNGQRYLAWHLPNSYHSLHQRTAVGRTRKINRKLTDLVDKGAQGNSREQVEKRYYANGKAAALVWNRDTTKEVYWPTKTVSSQSRLWSVFSLT